MSRDAPVDFSASSFDDSHWAFAVDEGPHGMAPYGVLLGTSTARWIWSYDSNLPINEKPSIEPAYFRKTFFVWADGTPHPTPGPCP